MAQGDITVFDEAKLALVNGTFSATDTIKLAILDNTTTPAASTATPTLGDFTEVGTSGNYTAGGDSLGTLTSLMTEAAGTVTCDSTTNPSWVANASNDTDAFWGLIYNDSDVSDTAIAFVDLGGPVDMSAGDLTVTWNGSGIFTLA